MKIFKKVLFVVLALIMAINLKTVIAKGTDDDHKETIYHLSEYDYYVSIRKMKCSKAESIYGMCISDYERICNIEQEIKKLSELNDDELQSRGLSDNQILILREYDGSRLENNPQLRTVLATLSVTLSVVSSSSTAASVKANWSWNSKPLMISIDYYETVAFRWKAYNSSGAQVAAYYNSSNSYCYVTYYEGSNVQTTQLESINVGNTGSYVFTQYTSGAIYGGNSCWAKKGYMVIRVTGSSFSRVDFGFGYNHGVTSTPAIVTLDGNLGFNYSNGYEMAEQSISATS
jgi:hypothetical protein